MIFYLDAIAPVLPLLVLVASRGKQIKGRLTVIIFFSLCLVFFSIADYIDEYEDGNNLLVYNLLPLLLVIDLFFFFRTLHVNPVLRKINLLLLVCQVVIYFLKYDYILEYRVFGSLFYIVFSLFTLVNCLGYYYQEFMEMGEVAVWKKVEFWFVTSTLFYASTSFVIWAFFKTLMDKAALMSLTKEEMHYIGNLWQLHNIAFALSCVGFFLALLWNKYRTTS
ncbi:MAG: hypothetical protein ACKO96_01445 [Flammeovirgaceae bacterium]